MKQLFCKIIFLVNGQYLNWKYFQAPTGRKIGVNSGETKCKYRLVALINGELKNMTFEQKKSWSMNRRRRRRPDKSRFDRLHILQEQSEQFIHAANLVPYGIEKFKFQSGRINALFLLWDTGCRGVFHLLPRLMCADVFTCLEEQGMTDQCGVRCQSVYEPQ